MLLIMAAGCTDNDKMSGVLEMIPADADFVAVGSFKTIIESAGGSVDGSQVELPDYITGKMSENDTEEYEEFKSLLKKTNVDLNACALTINYEGGDAFFVMAMNDEEEFVNAIESEDFTEKETENGATFYAKRTHDSDNDDYDKFAYLAVKNGLVLGTPEVRSYNVAKVTDEMKRMIEEAEKKSFAGTAFGDYITSGNAAGIAVRVPDEAKDIMKKAGIAGEMLNMYEGVVCMKSDLTDNSAKVSMKWFDEEGKEKDFESMNKFMNLNAKINADALSYMGPDEFFIYAASIKDANWDEYLNMLSEVARMKSSEKTILLIAKSYLEKIDGTVALGFGLKNGMQSFFKIDKGKDIVNEMSATIVCELEEGKAEGIMNDIKTLLDQQSMPYNSEDDGISMTLPDGSGSVYLGAKDDILVLSNHKIEKSDNPVVDNIDFDNYIFASGVYLSKDNPLMKDLGVKNDVKMEITVGGKSLETNMTLEMEGESSTGIIEKIIKTVIGIAEESEKLTQKRYK